MFEDKRFKNDTDNNSNSFFIPDNSTGLRDGNDNLNFGEQPVFRQPLKPKKEKKSKNKIFLKLILILFILSIFGGGIYLVYKNLFNNPYKVYKNVINYSFDYLNSKLNNLKDKKLDYDIKKDILSSSGSFKIDSNLLESLNGYEFKYKLAMDLNKEMLDSNLIINNNSTEVLNIDGVLRDKNILINSKDIYNKYLQISRVDNLDLAFNNIGINDNILTDILKVVKNTLINDLDKNKLNIEKTKIKVQNENLKVIANNYKLDSNDVKKIYQNIIDSLINDSNIIENLADMLNLRKAEVKEALEKLKTNEYILNSFKSLEFKIYTSGITNKVIGVNILFDGKDNINFTNYKNVLKINSGTDNNKLEILKNNSDTNINYNFDNGLISLVITNKDDTYNYEFNIETKMLEMEGNLTVEIKRVANKKVTTDILLDAKGKNDKDNFNINLELNSTVQVGGTIQNIPKANIVNYEDLSELEKKEIDNKFRNILEKLPFKNLFQNNEEPINNCDIATNCECMGSICTCSYLDINGESISINCLNKNIVTD